MGLFLIPQEIQREPCPYVGTFGEFVHQDLSRAGCGEERVERNKS
jgi:hypothetical protein